LDAAWAVLRLPQPEQRGEETVLWDVNDKRAVKNLPDVGRLPDFVLVSPGGRRMAYTEPHARGTVRLWDWQSNRFTAVLSSGMEHVGTDQSFPQYFQDWASFSPDGELLAMPGIEPASNLEATLIWQVETGKLVARLQGALGCCRWSPDGRWLAKCGQGSPLFRPPAYGGLYLQLWELQYPSRSYSAPVALRRLTLSPSGKYLGWENNLWQLVARGDDVALEPKERNLPGDYYFLPDGSAGRAWVTTDNRTRRQTLYLKLLDPASSERALELKETGLAPGAMGDYLQLARADFAPDGRRVLLGLESWERVPLQMGWQDRYKDFNRLARLEWWDVEDGRRLAVLDGAGKNQGQYMPWGMRLAGTGESAVVHGYENITIWNVANGNVVQHWPRDTTVALMAVFTPDGRYLASVRSGEWVNERSIVGTKTKVDIYEISTGRLVQSRELSDSGDSISPTAIALHLESGWLALKRGDRLELWNLQTGALWAWWVPHEGADFTSVFSHDGKLLVTASAGTIRLWPLQQLQRQVESWEHGPFIWPG
jgi:hypothetical protein